MKSIYHLVWLQFFLQTINAIDNENLAINEKEIVLTTDASHPAIIAAEKISDIEIRSEITDLFHKNSILWNRLIGWFKHEVCDPEKATAILENWRQCRIEERPILDVKKFFSQERVKLENLEENVNSSIASIHQKMAEMEDGFAKKIADLETAMEATQYYMFQKEQLQQEEKECIKE